MMIFPYQRGKVDAIQFNAIVLTVDCVTIVELQGVL